MPDIIGRVVADETPPDPQVPAVGQPSDTSAATGGKKRRIPWWLMSLGTLVLVALVIGSVSLLRAPTNNTGQVPVSATSATPSMSSSPSNSPWRRFAQPE
jgi:hypothetical protein